MTASALDLSRLPPFQLVEVDYEAERAALLEGVTARLNAKGIPYTAGAVESDPVVALVEEVAYRKTLNLAAVNDAGRSLTLVYGEGAELDHLAATYYADIGLARLNAGTELEETDERFRQRIALAPEARSAGTLGGYEFWALTYGPNLTDAKALNHASGLVDPGTIAVVLLGGADEADQVALVQDKLLDRSVKLGSDTLFIRAATRHPLAGSAILEVGPGPDKALVLTEAQKSLAAYLAACRKIGEPVVVSGLHAALTVGGVKRVRLLAPTEDVAPPADGIVDVTAFAVEVVNV